MEGVGDDNRSSIEDLVAYLSQHFYEAELSVALFTAAVTSYRCDSLLKPFPPMYIVDGEPDISALAADVKSIPCLKQLAAGKLSISSQLADLLLWVVKYRKTKLKHLPSSSFEELTKQTGKYLPMGNPQHLYELQFNEQSEAAFTNLAADRKVFCAFHGSRLENFFSILHHGLCGHMNKTSLFGEGTYLSTEPSVAANFSPWGHTGRSATQSVFGHSMSVLALCEVIDDPSVKHSFDSEKVDRKAPNSMGGDVPDKYVVVTNNDMLRVKYLLVYSEARKSHDSSGAESTPTPSLVTRLLRKYGYWLSLFFYVFVLLLIGLFNSKSFWRQVRRLYENTFDSLGWSGSDSSW